MHSLKKLHLLLLSFSVILILCGCSDASKGPLIGSLLQHFDELANKTLNQATKDLDYLSVKNGNQLEIMVKNLMIQFDGRYDIALRDLKEQEQDAFRQLQTMEDIISQGVKTIRRTEELAHLDLMHFTGMFPLFSRSPWFYISSINGLSIDQTEQTHQLEIVGIGFGYSDSYNNYNVSLTINGRPVSSSSFARASDKELVVNMPVALYRDVFKDTTVNFIPVTFKVIKSNIGKDQKLKGVDSFSINFQMTILPKFGATLELEEVIASSEPKSSDFHDVSYPNGESSAEHPNAWTTSWTCEDNAIINKVEILKCVGSGCGWCGGFEFDISNARKTANVRMECNGPACTEILRFYFTTYEDKPKILPKVKMSVELNKVLEISLSPDNKKHEYTISGHSFLGEIIYVNNSITSKPQGPIEYIGGGDYAGRFRMSVKITPK